MYVASKVLEEIKLENEVLAMELSRLANVISKAKYYLPMLREHLDDEELKVLKKYAK